MEGILILAKEVIEDWWLRKHSRWILRIRKTLQAREKEYGLKRITSSEPVELGRKVHVMGLYKLGLERGVWVWSWGICSAHLKCLDSLSDKGNIPYPPGSNDHSYRKINWRMFLDGRQWRWKNRHGDYPKEMINKIDNW